MPQDKVIVDTNAYLRLAREFHPLLGQQIGCSNFYLYVLKELNEELLYAKLSNQFPWTQEASYRDNRSHYPSVSKKQKKSIASSFRYMWDYVVTDRPGPSKVDVYYLAYCIELNIPVVTDDADMVQLAEEYEIEVWSMLELLKLILDSGHAIRARIDRVVGFLQHERDLPYRPQRFMADFGRLFDGSD